MLQGNNYCFLLIILFKRMKLLAGNSKLLEFGLRRAQGPDGGLSASQYSYLGGFDGKFKIVIKKYFNKVQVMF